MVTLAIGVAALATWIYLGLARGFFWRTSELAEDGWPVERPLVQWPAVGAVIPARDEADFIERATDSVIGQDYPGRLEVFVVDDGSSDGTGDIVRRKAAQIAAAKSNHSLRVIEGGAPPAGWTGKLWAMQQGVAALAAESKYILFVDADILLGSRCLTGLVASIERRGLTLSSLMVTLKCRSAAEQWLVPAFVFFFRMIYPFRWVNDPAKRSAAGAGGCMLVRRCELDDVGGLAALRGALIDDCAFARVMKKRGPIRLELTREATSLRDYPDVKAFGRMVSRSAFAQLGYSNAALIGVVLAMSVVFLAPPLLAIFGQGAARATGGLAWAAMALLFAPTLSLYGRPAWTAVALPAIAALYLGFTLRSALDHWRGRGGLWKGRYQAPAKARSG